MIEKYALGMLIVIMLIGLIFFLNMLVPAAVRSFLEAMP